MSENVLSLNEDKEDETTLHPPRPLLYLSQSRGLYIGPFDGMVMMRQPTPLLLVGLNKTISLNGRSGHAFLVEPGTRVKVICAENTAVAQYFLDRNDIDYCSLQNAMQDEFDGVWTNNKDEQQLISLMQGIYHTAPPLLDALYQVLNFISAYPPNLSDFIIDYPRPVKRLVDYIRTNPIYDLPLDSVAYMERMHPKTLRELFKNNVGIDIEEYQNWRRIFEVAYNVFRGFRLNEAITKGGFSSFENFNACFKYFFGFNAEKVFNDATRIMMNRYGRTF